MFVEDLSACKSLVWPLSLCGLESLMSEMPEENEQVHLENSV